MRKSVALTDVRFYLVDEPPYGTSWPRAGGVHQIKTGLMRCSKFRRGYAVRSIRVSISLRSVLAVRQIRDRAAATAPWFLMPFVRFFVSLTRFIEQDDFGRPPRKFRRGDLLRKSGQRGSAFILVMEPQCGPARTSGLPVSAPSAPFLLPARRQVRLSICPALIVIKTLDAPCALVTAP